ncbi:hypothetical protein AALC17_17885 [Oscillospiraceae bacterium 38-13]
MSGLWSALPVSFSGYFDGFQTDSRENVCVNGVSYKLGSLLYGPNRPAVADKPISRVYDGYYRQLNFSV